MAALPDASEASLERKKDAVLMLGVGSVGFLFLGAVALLLSPRYHGSATSLELLGASLVGFASGIFLLVAVAAVWLDQSWVGRWHD